MRKDWTLTQEAFDLLLEWLSSDREKAGALYEEIRSRLIKIFQIRGCANAEILSDETINRVTSKLPELIPIYEGDPVRYFYNVANKIHLESISSKRKKEEQLDPEVHARYFGIPQPPEDDAEVPVLYLQQCLNELPKQSRQLVLEYFAVESAKSENRRILAEKAGMNLNILRIKILRLKRKLRACILSKQTVAA